MVGGYIHENGYIGPEIIHIVQLKAAQLNHIVVIVMFGHLPCQTAAYIARQTYIHAGHFENMVYELMLKSGKDLNSKIEKEDGFFSVNAGELVLMLEKANQELIDNIIALNPQKIIALDKLFTGNDQLKTNTVLQMKDAGIEFKTI